MKYFNVYSLTRLRNQEFSAAYGQICSILEKDEISVEYVAQSLEVVKAHKAKLIFLKNMNVRHPLTKTITELKHTRHDALTSLKGRVTSILKSPIKEECDAAKVLATWLLRYHKHLSRASIHEQTSMVNEMMDEMNKSANIQTAITIIGVTNLIDSIQANTMELEEVFLTRNKERKEERREAYEMKHVAYADMKMLFNSIEMAITLGDGDSAVYMGYVNEVNGIMETFKTKYLSRISRLQNAEQEENDENQHPEPENEEQDGDNGVSTNGKPAMANGKRTFNAMTLNSMDLHNRTSNKDLDNKHAMSESVTNGEAIDEEDESVANLITGNEKLVNDTFSDTKKNASETHESATSDDSGQES